MRAYFSTGAGHADDGSRYVCGLNVESALAEARAILAETEPETPDASHVPASSLRWYDVTPREASYRFMLAEALAAFVEGN